MSHLIRFRVNDQSMSGGASAEKALRALAHHGRSNGDEGPEFQVWCDPAYPDVVVEYLRGVNFVTALHAVKRSVERTGLNNFTGGDLHLPTEPIKP